MKWSVSPVGLMIGQPIEQGGGPRTGCGRASEEVRRDLARCRHPDAVDHVGAIDDDVVVPGGKRDVGTPATLTECRARSPEIS
jgi:hypothetical protein